MPQGAVGALGLEVAEARPGGALGSLGWQQGSCPWQGVALGEL